MEAVQFQAVASRHFSSVASSSPSLPTTKPLSYSKTSSPRFRSPWSGTHLSSTLSSRNSFSREIWSWVNSKPVRNKKEMRGIIRAEMFGQLTSGLESAWSKLKGEEVLTKENLVEPMRDIRRALLEADVSLPVVRRFVQDVTDQAVGTGLIRGVKPDQQLVKIVHDELVKLMGGEVSELVFSKSGPTVILLAGLQGVGKTTVCAKLAFYLKKQGKNCMLVAGDVYRPAAIDQLVILGQQVDVPVYTAGTDVKPSEIARQGLEEAKKKNIDVVIVDTAGRLQIDKAMMDELKDVKRALSPTEVLLVVDAMTGQEAAALVTTFNVEIGITGAILTKLDGDSRGGAALSVREVSGKPIKLVGRGERMEDLEPFYPDRMAGRILGMGDVLSFVEKAQEVMKQEDAEDLQKKIMSAKFDFNDFLKQTRAVARMGSVSRVIGMIPGMGKITPAQIRDAEKNLKMMESMIEAMTPEEREKPELLAESPVRRKRVAQDSGKTEQQVSQLVAQLFQMRVRMKNLMGVMEGGSIPSLSNLEDALKAEEKLQEALFYLDCRLAPPGTARRKRKSGTRRQFVDSTPARPGPRGFGSGN
ncbi:hypothetical protein TIFTF001_008685 [Ficus carica]|uniref:signal-recognition-particle GTPase n=1 Tax=Ficus carica TaxID=3494 RepID=A0AA87ZTW0_FICCA|nr:hypothetical protein TIFTF001_008685 [Ficus carica]